MKGKYVVKGDHVPDPLYVHFTNTRKEWMWVSDIRDATTFNTPEIAKAYAVVVMKGAAGAQAVAV